MRLILTTLLYSIICSSAAFATTINDYGEVDIPITGTVINVPADQPSIQAAINIAAPGDTVLVAPGTYQETINIPNGAVNLVSSDGAESTTLILDNARGMRLGNGSKLFGFTITSPIRNVDQVVDVFGSGTEIKYNVFKDSIAWTAIIWGNSASALIEKNKFINNTCDTQHLMGIISFVNTSRPQIVNNYFLDNACRAVNFTVPVSAAPFVINNTMIGNRTGIYVDRRIPSDNQTYRNNLVVDNQIGVHMPYGNDSYNPVFEHNLVYSNGVDYENVANQTGIEGNISVDPQFVDPTAGDYRLAQTSPAVDSGSTLGAPLEDYDGEPRPFDGNGDGVNAFDIGADEYSAKLQLTIAGGLTQECTLAGGSLVGVDATLTNDDTIISQFWSIDGAAATLNSNQELFVPLSNHTLSVRVDTAAGKTYSASAEISIEDTTKPDLSIHLVDQRSGEIINTIDSKGLVRVLPEIAASDICDANPVVSATGGFNVHSGQELRIQGNLDTIKLSTDTLKISATATDASGNTQLSEATLDLQ